MKFIQKKIVLLFLLKIVESNQLSIPINKVKELNLLHGNNTIGRRKNPIKQLTCEGWLCFQYAPNKIKCNNVGTDGIDIKWNCYTNLDSKVKFGKLDVNCEGFDFPEDPNILIGSCGLTYTLEYTNNETNNFEGLTNDNIFGIILISFLFIICLCCGHYYDEYNYDQNYSRRDYRSPSPIRSKTKLYFFCSPKNKPTRTRTTLTTRTGISTTSRR